MMKIKSRALRRGDKVGIISPSEPVAYKNEFWAGVETLKKLGFRVVLGKNFLRKYGAYMAGRPEERASDLNAMFKNPEIRGIFCSHGGFSSNQILDLIDYDAIKKNPKVFMGFSDITVLLNAIHKKTGLITFHGQHIQFGFSRGFSGKYKYTCEYFKKAVMNPQPAGPLKNWKEPVEILRTGKATGGLIGGNLEVLMTLIGTKYEPDWQNKILFWEEYKKTDEDIDFHLTHLKLCGALSKISGMVIGKLTEIRQVKLSSKPAKSLPIREIILNSCRDYKFPVIKNIAAGHDYPQLTLPIGAKATINTSKKIFSIDESAVI